METYQHYKNKKLYKILDTCLIQENDKWVEAIIYKDVIFEKKFCRSKKEFDLKFERV